MIGAMNMTGKLMNNSMAMGCFVVLLPEDGAPDVFRALLRPDDSSLLLSSTINNIPSSTYTVLVYDLEQELLPGHDPAYELANTVNISGKGFSSSYVSVSARKVSTCSSVESVCTILYED